MNIRQIILTIIFTVIATIFTASCGDAGAGTTFTVKCYDNNGKEIVNEANATNAYNSDGGFIYYVNGTLYKVNGLGCIAKTNQ